MNWHPRHQAVHVLVTLCLLAAALAPGGVPRAQDAPPAGDAKPQSAPQAAAPDTGGAEIPPEAISSFQTRVYSIKPRKLWKRLLETLATAGYPPEEVDQAAMKVKTSFVDFEAKDFSEHVADPPPGLTRTYHILQMVQVKQGKVSLEVILAPAEGGTALSVRARILVQGLDRRTRVMVLTDRRSSGVIEDACFEKIEDSLGLKRA